MTQAELYEMIERVCIEHRSAMFQRLQRLDATSDDADDALQDAFTRVIELIRNGLGPKAQDERSVIAWFFSITRNVLREGYRTNKRRKGREQRYVEARRTLVDPGPYEAFIQKEEQAEFQRIEDRLPRAMKRLKRKQRRVIRLFFHDGLRIAKIAKRVRASRKTVRKRIQRALENLSSELSKPDRSRPRKKRDQRS